MSGILESLLNRTTAFVHQELEQLAYALATEPTTSRQRDGFLRKIEQSGLVEPDLLQGLTSRVALFVGDAKGKNLGHYTGPVAADASGKLISPSQFHFKGVDAPDGVTVYISDRFADLTSAILHDHDADIKKYFAGTHTTLDKTLALSQIIIDHEAQDLQGFGKGGNKGLNTEDERTLLAWELLARIDTELNGFQPESVLHSHRLVSNYNALKGFVETSGLKPMSQRALAIRDGRDAPLGVFAGQGANYLLDLKNQLKDPTLKTIFNELKPYFAAEGIDLDKLLSLADADHNQIENYLAVNGISTTLGAVALTQILYVRDLEQSGFNFLDFKRLTGQSGGQPAANFAAFAYEDANYQIPLVPHGVWGYRSKQSYINFIQAAIAEGILMQQPNPVRYASDVTKMEPLVKDSKNPPSAQEIDAYFNRFHVASMSTSGIPFNFKTPELTEMGKVLKEINARFGNENSRALVTNRNTGDTPTGKNSHYLLVAGKGQALAELAKLIITKNAEGYSEEVQQIVEGWKTNENVKNPITNTRITFAPHDAVDLAVKRDEHLALLARLGIKLSAPRVPVIHNLTAIASDPADVTTDFTKSLSDQQFVEVVDMPEVISEALAAGVTSAIDLGTGEYQWKTALKANMGDTPVNLVGVSGVDARNMYGMARLKTPDPRAVFYMPKPESPEKQQTAIEKIASIPGVMVEETKDQGKLINLSIKITEELTPENIEAFKDSLDALDEESLVNYFLLAEKAFVNGKEVANQGTKLLSNRKNTEINIAFNDEGEMDSIHLVDRARYSVLIKENENDQIVVEEYSPHVAKEKDIPITRIFDVSNDGVLIQDMTGFAENTRQAFAQDWDIDLSAPGISDPYVPSPNSLGRMLHHVDTQKITAERMVHFAGGIQAHVDADKYLNVNNPDFQAHPHFLIDAMWKGMMTPAFAPSLGLDFTRVLDEGKTIEMGVPIKAGDEITTTAFVLKVEDFKTGPFEGRRVVVVAEAVNQHGQVVGRVQSSLISRIPTKLKADGTELIYEYTGIKPVDLLEGRAVHTNTEIHTIATGSLTIPDDLTDTYDLDPNRIHLSHLSANLAEIDKGRILQGLAELGFVNEQVIGQLQRDGISRAYRGIANLKFTGTVVNGEKLDYEVKRKAISEGDDIFEVIVKNQKNGTVCKYDLIMQQGAKTAMVFSGQGTQYEGMADDLMKNPELAAILGSYVAQIPLKADGTPMIDLIGALNAGSQDTSQAQPMIMAYSMAIFEMVKAKGLIPRDAAFTGHSLGEWIALVAAGALKGGVKAAMAAVHQRGSAMQAYNDKSNPQAMIAVIAPDGVAALDESKVEILRALFNQDADEAQGLKYRRLALANDNAPNQGIIGGHKAALEMATPLLQAWGYKVFPLGVKNAFHTDLMEPAAADFGKWMEANGNPFQIPEGVVIYSDIEAKPISEVGSGDAVTLADIMKRQIATNVRWRDTVQRMLKDGYRRFLEIGPSSKKSKASSDGILTGLIKSEIEALGIKDSVEVIFVNPLINEKDWDRVTLNVAPAKVSEFSRPELVIPEPKIEETPVAAKPEVAATPMGPVASAPVASAPQIVPISAAQLESTIAAFFAANIGYEYCDVEALSSKLADQLALLGAGARDVVMSRLAALSSVSATGSSAGDGATVLSKVLEESIKFAKLKPAAASKLNANSTTNDDLGVTSNNGNELEYYGTLAKALGVQLTEANFQFPSDKRISALVEILEKLGAKVGGGTVAAVASVTQVSSKDLFEKKALEKTLPRLPQPSFAMPMMQQMPSVPDVPQSQVQGVVDQFFAAHPDHATGEADALAKQLATEFVALGAGARNPLMSRLSGLSSVAGTGAPAGGGGTVLNTVLEESIRFAKLKPAAASKLNANSTTNDDLGVTSNNGNELEYYGTLAKALGVQLTEANFQFPSDKRISALVDILEKLGAKVGGGAPAGASVATASPKEVIEKKAIANALSRLPETPVPGFNYAMPAIAPVSPAQIESVRAGFISENKAAIAQSLTGQLVDGLSGKYQSLGAGAVSGLQARLSQLSAGSAQTVGAPAGGGTTVLSKVLEESIKFAKLKPAAASKLNANSTTNDDLGVTSNNGNELEYYGTLAKALGVQLTEANFQFPADKRISALVDILEKLGAKAPGSSAVASAAPSGALSNEDQLDKQAIEKALPALQAQLASMSSRAGPMSAGIDPAQMNELRTTINELQNRIAALEGSRAADKATGVTDRAVVVQSDGSVADATTLEIARLKQIIENVEKGTSKVFVHSLMQPHFKDNTIGDNERFGFSHIEQNGGRTNMLKFYADLRMGRLPKEGYDLDAEINVRANQMDAVSLSWLKGFIDHEQSRGKEDRVKVLQALYDEAKAGLDKDTIITKNVITIRAVDFVPDYGNPRQAIPTIRQDGTLAIWNQMKPLADPKTAEDVEWLISEGIDLRGVRALVQQAGTLSGPAIAKFMRLGATVDVTDFGGRAGVQPNGQNTNDYLWDMASKNGARGSSMNVITHMQPGNPHDEEALIKYYDSQAQQIKDNAALSDEQKKAEYKKILPRIYINGAAYSDYGMNVEKRGDPHSVLAILSISSRSIALNLAKLHLKYNTGEQVVFLNYYSPNSGIDLAAKADEMVSAIKSNKLPQVIEILNAVEGLDPQVLEQVKNVLLESGLTAEARIKGLFSILAGSGTYPGAKSLLGAGLTAGEAISNGIVYPDGRPVLVEVSKKTGWGKSNGEGAAIMAGNDFFTMLLERMAKEAGFDLLTLTGDQLATDHVSGILAAVAGRRNQVHNAYNSTYGFDEAAKRGELGRLMSEAKGIEEQKHREAKEAWKAKQSPVDLSRLPNDGSLVDLNNLNISIAEADAEHPYAAKPGDIFFEDNVPIDVGNGAVASLGPDAHTIFHAMLGDFDFYRLADSMRIDVSNWDVEEMADSVGIDKDKVKRFRGDWDKAFKQFILDNIGFQQVEDFVEFKVMRDVSYDRDEEITVDDPSLRIKMKASGYEFFERADGSVYAKVRQGDKKQIEMTYKLPVTVVGALPGQEKFNWRGFGITDRRDVQTDARASYMSKMYAAQIMMSMGGYSVADLRRRFGAKNVGIAAGTGAGNFLPLNKMTLDPIFKTDRVPSHLMGGYLGDADAGQLATEQLDAEWMALCVVAACSTGNANIVMAMRELFATYYEATKKTDTVSWPEVFKKLWIAGGSDYAMTFNAVAGFEAVGGTGALLRDDWRIARQLVEEHGSRPGDKERNMFVLAPGAGGQGITTVGAAKANGMPAYGMIIGGTFRTDGSSGGASREGYGKGQRLALSDAWEQAKPYLTEFRLSQADVFKEFSEALKIAKGSQNSSLNGGLLKNVGLKPTEITTLVRELKKRFPDFKGNWKDIAEGTTQNLLDQLQKTTLTLKKNIKIVVMGHMTSTKAGDIFENESLRLFLQGILPPNEFATLMASKAFLGHCAGGSSGVDAALTPYVLKHRKIPGVPGLDNLFEEGVQNAWLLYHKETVDLNEIYDDDATFVVIREAAGFGNKNTSVIEVYGNIPFKTEAEALPYVKGLIQGYAQERTDKQAERKGLRPMVFSANKFPFVPVSQYADLYELSLRSEAVAKALLKGQKFDFDKILDWVYQFPVDADAAIRMTDAAVLKGVQSQYIDARTHRIASALTRSTELKNFASEEEYNAAVDKLELDAFNRATADVQKAVEQLGHNEYNAIKFAEASQLINGIIESFKPEEIVAIKKMAQEKGWDKQPVVFYGVSDGMGMRTLLALIMAGAVKEVVGIHMDAPVDKIGTKALKDSSFTPTILKALAKARGVNLNVINTFDTATFANGGILFDRTGAEIPLQQPIIDAVEAARSRSEIKDINFFDYVAFGITLRRHGDGAIFVPSINEHGQLKYAEVPQAKDENFGQIATINTMGRSHARLLRIFNDRGWLGEKTSTFTADWWGSESPDMLDGVYGGALLGDAKNVAKAEASQFAKEFPNAGFHGYFGYPAFLSFALNAIPGGTLTGLIAKRIYEDIEGGMVIDGAEKPSDMDLRFYSMEELATHALVKYLSGELSGPKGNKVSVDTHEMAIAKEINRRFVLASERLKVLGESRRAEFFEENPTAEADEFQSFILKQIVDTEQSYELLKDLVPADYLRYTHQHIRDVNERVTKERIRHQDANGIESLPLPAALQTRYPFFMRAYSKAMNTPELVIEVIDNGGVGTLAADDLSPEELSARITQVKEAVSEDLHLVVNVMMTSANRDAQIEAILQNKPNAVSIGNGIVSKEIVDKLHKAGILVIQLAGTVNIAKELADKKVDLVIAERNIGPGHFAEGAGADAKTLFKRMRQALYDQGIPVIAGNGFVDVGDIKEARHWGASAIQLDDPIAYSAESTYAGKAAHASMDAAHPFVEIRDEDDKPMRFLNTPAAQTLVKQIEGLKVGVINGKQVRPLSKEELKPLLKLILQKGFHAAAIGDALNGLFLAGQRIAQVNVGETLESVFKRLSGEVVNPTPPSGDGGDGNVLRGISLPDFMDYLNAQKDPAAEEDLSSQVVNGRLEFTYSNNVADTIAWIDGGNLITDLQVLIPDVLTKARAWLADKAPTAEFTARPDRGSTSSAASGTTNASSAPRAGAPGGEAKSPTPKGDGTPKASLQVTSAPAHGVEVLAGLQGAASKVVDLFDAGIQMFTTAGNLALAPKADAGENDITTKPILRTVPREENLTRAKVLSALRKNGYGEVANWIVEAGVDLQGHLVAFHEAAYKGDAAFFDTFKAKYQPTDALLADSVIVADDSGIAADDSNAIDAASAPATQTGDAIMGGSVLAGMNVLTPAGVSPLTLIK